MLYEKNIDEFLFSSDKKKLQIKVIHQYLNKESYWAQNIPVKVVKTSIKGSICFGVYFRERQIGFGRVISDKASFAYMADVFILNEHQGKELGKKLIAFIMECPDLKGLRRFMLATKDAHALYTKFGFTNLATPERFMELKPFEKYSN